MERILRAKVANGKIVELKQPPVFSAEAITRARGQLVAMLDSEIVGESEVSRFLGTVFPVLFPSADPGKPAIFEPSIWQGVRGDIGFSIRQSDKIGLVEVKPPKTNPKILETIFEWGQLESAIARSGIESQVAEVNIVVGQSWVPFAPPTDSGDSSFSVNIHTWDDLIERLTVGEQGADVETIFFVEVVESARRLLSRLVTHPDILSAIDDRRFEELVATLLSDLGFSEVELTPPRKDGGKDVLGKYKSPNNGQSEMYLFECKHWVSGGKVSISVATELLDVVKAEDAAGGILLASGGFGPKLIEQEASWNRDKIFLKDANDFAHWVSVWERQYGSVLLSPVNVMELLDLK